MSTSKAFILNLPTEIHHMIIGPLEVRDLFNVALTCRRLSDIALSELHTDIFIHDLGDSLSHYRRLLETRACHDRIVVLNMTLSKTSEVISHQEVDDFRNRVFDTFHFPKLMRLSLRSGELTPREWYPIFWFLKRHTSIEQLEIDFLYWRAFRRYDPCSDNERYWRHALAVITPDFLPSLNQLSCDTSFLALLARARVSSLKNLDEIDLHESCLAEHSDYFWVDISFAMDLLENTPIVVFSYLNISRVEPPFHSILNHLVNIFKHVEQLSTNVGEGVLKETDLLDYLPDLDSLRTLSVPALLVRECLSGYDENTPRPWLAGAHTNYSEAADLEFRKTREVLALIEELDEYLQQEIGDCPIKDIILHMPGWSPHCNPSQRW